MTQEELIAYHKMIIEMGAEVDSKPKNIFMPIPKGEEYKHMCFQLAQGYEMDYITFPWILVNEFGEGEHVDSFNRRHPNFAQDIADCRTYWKQMNYKITEFKEWPKGLETSYHDWVVRASNTEITEKLGFKPKYNPSGDKWTYQWNCCLNDGEYYFILYDMSYGSNLEKDEVTEYHIGFPETYDDIHNFFPESVNAINMLIALEEHGLKIDHSEIWKRWHADGTFDDIERMVKKQLIGEKDYE